MATQTIPVPAEQTQPAALSMSAAPRLTLGQSLRHHWPEYAMEGALLGGFMISACLFGALYYHPASPVGRAIESDLLRRVCMGLSMGLTAIAIVYSPWGKQSGAHINPSTTLTFYRLGKIPGWDAALYMLAQLTGAALGVAAVSAITGPAVTDPAVNYVVTVPGPGGWWPALRIEFFMAATMMLMVLYMTTHHSQSRYTGLYAGALVAVFITLWAPVSGMSINPARSFGSAIPSGIWEGFWIYITAPPLGMLAAAEIFLWREGRLRVKCCKLHHDNEKRCIFCGANGGFPDLSNREGARR